MIQNIFKDRIEQEGLPPLRFYESMRSAPPRLPSGRIVLRFAPSACRPAEPFSFESRALV